MSIHRFSSTESFITAAAETVTAAALAVLSAQRKLVIALPGGSTAYKLVPALCAAPLPWERITFTLTDERWVAPDYPGSNEGLLRSLITGATTAAAFAGYFREGIDAAAATTELENRIPQPDIALLGMGADGHIASIFPHDAANHSAARFAFVVRPDYPRLTLTPLALTQSRHLFVVTNGGDKAAMLERAVQDGAADDLPVRHALNAGAAVFLGP